MAWRSRALWTVCWIGRDRVWGWLLRCTSWRSSFSATSAAACASTGIVSPTSTPPRRTCRIESLARELRERLSDRCRVATGAFERRNYSRDMARVPRLLEKVLHRTRPLLVVQPKQESDVADRACLRGRAPDPGLSPRRFVFGLWRPPCRRATAWSWTSPP